MRRFLIPLAAAVGLTALATHGATAMPLAQVPGIAPSVQQIQYYESGDWRWRRHAAWRRHEAWREWRHERWVARHEGAPPGFYGRY